MTSISRIEGPKGRRSYTPLSNRNEPISEEIPYSSPEFKELELSNIGKIRVGVPDNTAFCVGLVPVIRKDGGTSHLATSHNPEIIPIEDFNSITSFLCHELGKHFTYVVYEPYALDSFLKFLPYELLYSLYDKGTNFFEGTRIWFSPSQKLTLLKEGKEARIHVIGNWSRRLTCWEACRRAGMKFAEGDILEEAKALAHLGNEILDRIEKITGRRSGNLSTPSILTKQTLSKDLRRVKIETIPEEALEMAYSSLHAPWIEMLAQGYFPETYDYDLNSAYPNEIRKLLLCDKTTGKWFRRNEYVEEAEYGFCKAIISIENTGTSPIRYRKHTGQLFSPYGTWVGYLTKGEIDFIGRKNVEILEGWWFVLNSFTLSTPGNPTRTSQLRIHLFEQSVENLLELRKAEKDPVLRSMAKSIAARMNGRFLQKEQTLSGKWVAGPMFNPIYAVQVMTQTKLSVAKLAATARGVLSITVDGLVTKNPIRRNSEWKLVVKSPAIIVAPLIMHLEDRETRYSILRELWKNPNKKVYEFGERMRITMKEALLLRDTSRIAEQGQVAVSVRVGGNISRIWTGLPTFGGDLLEKSYYSNMPPVEWVEMGRGRKK